MSWDRGCSFFAPGLHSPPPPHVYMLCGEAMGEACGWYRCVREVGVMFEIHSGIHEAHI